MEITLMDVCWAAMTIFPAFSIIRINRVAPIRMKILKTNFQDFEFLPSFNRMMYSPKFLLLWTEKAWQAWINRQKALNKQP